MKILGDYTFEFIENLTPVIDRNGSIKEFYPQNGYKNLSNLSYNRHGDGPFCKFSINPKHSGVSGVYIFIIDGELVYIGQCLDFAKRFNMGYGNISPRCCYVQGQSTNCKMNKIVLESTKAKKIVAIYFHRTANYNQVENELIKLYNPVHNVMLKDRGIDMAWIKNTKTVFTKRNNTVLNTVHSPQVRGVTNNPSIEDVRKYIRTILMEKKEKGLSDYELVSGDIHKDLNMQSALPTVCSAMRTLGGGYIYITVEEPPKGNGTRLKLKYKLN